MLKEIKENYKHGLLTRKAANLQTSECIKYLYDLSDDLKDSVVNKIEILIDEVVLNINHCNHNIKLCAEKNGKISIATTLLFSDTVEEDLDLVEFDFNNAVFFDIGANVGWYSIVNNIKFPNATIYSFEPLKYTYDYLIKNFKLNNLTTDKAFNIGFSNENKDIVFYFNQGSTESSSMRDLKYLENDKSNEVVCKVERMDDFCKNNNINHIDFIKCDVEGAELFVYEGGENIISSTRPIVLSELLRKWTAKFNYHPNDVLSFFEKLNYKCIALGRDNSKRLITSVDESTIETNFLFIPDEKFSEKFLYEKNININSNI